MKPRLTSKRITVILAGSALALSTAACSGSGDTDSEAVKIGMVEPKTGPVSYDGESVINGAKIAEKAINDDGGINGKTLDLIIEDGEGDPTASIDAYQKLVRSDNVDAMIGAWSSSATLAIKERVEKDKIPFVAETASSPKVTGPDNQWLFRVAADLKLAAESFKQIIVDDMGYDNVAFISVNNDWGQDTTEAFREVIESAGGTAGKEYTVEPGDVDFKSVLNRIGASDAEQVIVTTDINGIGTLMEQRNEVGMDDVPFFVTAGIPGQTIQDKVAPLELSNVDIMNYWVPDPVYDEAVADETKTFVNEYKSSYPDRNVDKYAANGYDAVKVLADAIEEAGSTDAEEIQKQLQENEYDLLTGSGQFDDDGQITAHVSWSRIDEGDVEFVRYTVSK